MKKLTLLILLVLSSCGPFVIGELANTATEKAKVYIWTSKPAEPKQEHVHCGVNRVFCWDSDGQCCSVCGGKC